MKKQIFSLRTLIVLAVFAALGAVFSAFFSIQLNFTGIKTVGISLAPIPVMLAGIFFGPLAGFLVGFVTDTAGFFMGVPMGPYNILFSITMGLFGVIAGLFYLRAEKRSLWRAAVAAPVAQIVVSVVLNTLIIWQFYGVPLSVLLPTRLISAAAELPVYILLLMGLVAGLWPLMNKWKIQEQK